MENVWNSFNDLFEKEFVVRLEDHPQDERLAITSQEQKIFIPNSIFWKEKSHSTKVRVCWDASIK